MEVALGVTSALITLKLNLSSHDPMATTTRTSSSMTSVRNGHCYHDREDGSKTNAGGSTSTPNNGTSNNSSSPCRRRKWWQTFHSNVSSQSVISGGSPPSSPASHKAMKPCSNHMGHNLSLHSRSRGLNGGYGVYTFRAILACSLGLFSLSILESSPASWCLFLHPSRTREGYDYSFHQEDLSPSLLTSLYQVLLCTDVVLIAVVVPVLLVRSLMPSWQRTLSEHEYQEFIATSAEYDGTTTRMIPNGVGVGADEDSSIYTKLKKSPPTGEKGILGMLHLLVPPPILTLCSKRNVIAAMLGCSLSWCFYQSCLGGLVQLVVVVMPKNPHSPPTHHSHPPYHENTTTHGIWFWFQALFSSSFYSSPSLQCLLQDVLTRICALGLIISAALNGFGAVSMPHSYLVGAWHDPVDPARVATVEEDGRRVLLFLEEKKRIYATEWERQLQQHQHQQEEEDGMCSQQQQQQSSSAAAGGGYSGIMGGILHRRRRNNSTNALSTSNNNNNNNNNNTAAASHATSAQTPQTMTQLTQEIIMLEQLHHDLQEEAEELQEVQQLVACSQTLLGRCKRFVGLICSMVLLVQLMLAVRTITRQDNVQRRNGGDIITTALLWLVGRHYVTPEQTHALAQALSLVMTAVLSVSQVRNFFRVAAILNRRWTKLWRSPSSSSSSSSSSLSSFSFKNHGGRCTSLVVFPWRHQMRPLLLSCAMGAYFLSSILIIKMNLVPVEYRMDLSAALVRMSRPMGMEEQDLVDSAHHAAAAATTSMLEYTKNVRVDASGATVVSQIMFATFACLSGVVFAMVFGIRKQNAKMAGGSNGGGSCFLGCGGGVDSPVSKSQLDMA